MHQRHTHAASDCHHSCPLRWLTWAATMLTMRTTTVVVVNNSQRRLRTMGSGSSGGGVMAEVEGDVWMQRQWPAAAR